MRIAYFSPLPPQKTGIADYSAALLPSLAEFVELDVYTDDALIPQLPAHPSISIRPISAFQGPLDKSHHMCVYQMGANVHFHDNIFKKLRRYPGIVVLHDLNMNSFFGELYLMQQQVTEYTRLMACTYGAQELPHVRSAHRGDTPYNTAKYPLFEPLVARSLGTIVHSLYAESIVRQRCPATIVKRMQLVTSISTTPIDIAKAKCQLGFAPSDLIVAAFGHMSPSKRLDKLLTASTALRDQFPQMKLVFVGEVVPGYDLSSEIAALGLNDITRLTGYVEKSVFHTYLAATDIGFNLRHPTIGESSATLAALMASSKPTLMSNIDAFTEYPDDICIKIDVGENEELQIESALNQLLSNAELRSRIGHNARRYIELTSTPSIVARQYMDFLDATANDFMSGIDLPGLQ